MTFYCQKCPYDWQNIIVSGGGGGSSPGVSSPKHPPLRPAPVLGVLILFLELKEVKEKLQKNKISFLINFID